MRGYSCCYGDNGTSFQSIKLAAFTDPSAVLLETIASRLSKTPQMLRPPVPSELSELRIKLAMVMKPKAREAQQETTFASETKAKVFAPSPSPLAPHPAHHLPFLTPSTSPHVADHGSHGTRAK